MVAAGEGLVTAPILNPDPQTVAGILFFAERRKFKGCQGFQTICISVMILEQIANSLNEF